MRRYLQSQNFLQFENPLRSFPIAAVHGILGLREKLLDRIPCTAAIGKERNGVLKAGENSGSVNTIAFI